MTHRYRESGGGDAAAPRLISNKPVLPDGAQDRIIVIIPAFNEERFIASVVFQTRPFANEVVVVDDGSTDRTAQMAEAAGATVLRLDSNSGKAAALNAGFAYAKGRATSAVVCLDGDSQHEPSDIPALVKPIVAGDADVVIGSRFLSTRSRIPGWRKVGQHTLTAMTNGMSGTNVTDSQSGFLYGPYFPAKAAEMSAPTGRAPIERARTRGGSMDFSRQTEQLEALVSHARLVVRDTGMAAIIKRHYDERFTATLMFEASNGDLDELGSR